MRRRFEFLVYAVFILFFVFRYADGEQTNPRRPVPDRETGAPMVILPEGALLPQDISSTVVVSVDPKNQASVGTAFSVDDKGTFVSARHVIEDCTSIAILQNQRAYPAQLVAKASNRDFAVLKVRGTAVEPFELTLDAPTRGVDGFMMGYPQGVPADVHATVIGQTVMRSQGRYNTRERVVAWVERERRPGFSGSLGGISGGPVLDAQGRIIGTVVAGAPRRGRVYTTNPQVFEEAGLVPQPYKRKTGVSLSRDNFDKEAGSYRKAMRIAQVYCAID